MKIRTLAFAGLFFLLNACDFSPQEKQEVKNQGFPEIRNPETAAPTTGATGEPTSPTYNESDSLILPEPRQDTSDLN
ncbi:hypothetical protein [Siphonobacter sp. SORGH_AS_0500]|uniref:hypothetical protein n=1 Tax=Siphonobacter sp. SORGH_AS_0500 TaxID=1864824 RepID=UPI000CB2D311|nr:hypothetical protein [Siphonobacter sp. SORGH_AS_0500]MDR6195562.1 hypothetical protein [Siphonobacter sp. SORGH_AS_0500]PKK35328.1 hypothetical protein BWI96_17520 [Siphonobacter sp. SORGH_AS_0500]